MISIYSPYPSRKHNWFYPFKNWPIKTEDTYSFEIIYKGSVFLVEEFPNRDNYYDDTKEELEKI